ncbi:unnamed protein product [Staurois parvus]|uniref:Uncharacterized protein n=1 Tax=Staurois parvus TaxID=386267 RepID=A0ABN9E843_9NEOB|nr:unnamed protein product [Staurois parvus]
MAAIRIQARCSRVRQAGSRSNEQIKYKEAGRWIVRDRSGSVQAEFFLSQVRSDTGNRIML